MKYNFKLAKAKNDAVIYKTLTIRYYYNTKYKNAIKILK